jgi:hypothetical protein
MSGGDVPWLRRELSPSIFSGPRACRNGRTAGVDVTGDKGEEGEGDADSTALGFGKELWDFLLELCGHQGDHREEGTDCGYELGDAEHLEQRSEVRL